MGSADTHQRGPADQRRKKESGHDRSLFSATGNTLKYQNELQKRRKPKGKKKRGRKDGTKRPTLKTSPSIEVDRGGGQSGKKVKKKGE